MTHPICKKCNRRLRTFTNISTGEMQEPVEDSITVCAFCATICKFDKDKNQVPLTSEEGLQLIKEDPKGFLMLMRIKNKIENLIFANNQ